MSSREEIQVETLIIGAGLIGSSVAMHLAKKGMKGIRVVDLDLEGALSSSELNAGGVRATLAQPINIEMSKITIDYFAEHAEEVGYNPCGYLWLYTPERLKRAMAARELQMKLGWEVQVLDERALASRLPFIDKREGIAGATFAPKDGLVNSNLLKNHFRSEARKLGVVFEDRVWIRGSELGSSAITVHAEKFEAMPSLEARIDILSGERTEVTRGQISYRAQRVVNSAGAWAGPLAIHLGYVSPVFPVRRQVCLFDCRDVDLTKYGMIVDTSGVYFHPEATNGLAGFANREEPQGINYRYDGESFFTDVIWPALYERSTAFERLKHVSGWAGQYEVSPDESAIIGLVEDGDAGKSGRVYEAHSFSGHGVMHSYAAGLALAEKMVNGRYESADVEQLSGSRFSTGMLVPEGLVI